MCNLTGKFLSKGLDQNVTHSVQLSGRYQEKSFRTGEINIVGHVSDNNFFQLKQLASGLKYLHASTRRIVHGDGKYLLDYYPWSSADKTIQFDA